MIRIKACNLSKNFNEVEAVKNVSFEVKAGEIFGLIGPDGAGKTTIFRMLTTLMLPDSGSALVNGNDVVKNYKEIRSQVGYMPGRFSLYQDLTVEENLNFFAAIFHTSVKENYDLIADIYTQIEPFKNRRAGKLSGGMKQKLALCCALIHKPAVLFLDEPTTGVDVVSRKEFWEMLTKLKALGLSILVSTPYMDEANRCDRVALIQKGEILQIDTPQRIISNFPTTLWAAKAKHIYHLLKDLENDEHVSRVYAFGEYLHFILKENCSITDIEPKLTSYQDIDYKSVEPTIEDAFIGMS